MGMETTSSEELAKIIDPTKKQFVGRIRQSDGTYGLSSTMSLDDLLKGLIDYLPMDLIYKTSMSEDGIIELRTIGRIGLSFKADGINKEKFHEKEQVTSREVRQESNFRGEEDIDRSGRTGLGERRGDGKDERPTPRKPKKSPKKHNGPIISREAERGDVDKLSLALKEPTPENIKAIIDDQKKSRGRPRKGVVLSNNKDGERAANRFKAQFDNFGPRKA